MKKVISLSLVVFLLLSLFGCAPEKTMQDDSPITIFVGLGNNATYYNRLKEVIRENLGYEVEFIYQTAIDTTSAVRLEFKNNDLPADIVATASPTREEDLRTSALDLMNYTHISDFFTYQKLTELTYDDGTLYQLPFTTRLIGITYNQTLLDEMGWEVPTCYADMLDLKQKCDEAGILFSVSAMVATGHGFNYLFHTMGTQWLSTLEGAEWFQNFMAGKADIGPFREQAEYFADWVENGLFGNAHTEDWNAAREYCTRRALFFFDLTNSVYSYEGDIVDENGQVIGQVKDEYKSIPWLSRDGTNNCYTYYDNMYISLNKKLAGADQAERLNKCIKILELMTTAPVTDIFKETYPDGYVAVNAFAIDETRNYAGYSENITKGYTMPWYYSYFDNDSIVQTGQLINSYIKDGSASFDDIMNQLQTCRDRYLQQETPSVCTLEKTLDYADVAALNAAGALRAYREELVSLGIEDAPSFALVPYVSQLSELLPFSTAGVVSTKAYAGELQENDVSTIIPSKGQKVVGIYLQGSELKELLGKGLQEENRTYSYAIAGDAEIEAEKTYLVVVSTVNLDKELYARYVEEGRILTKDGKAVTAAILTGVRACLTEKFPEK